MLGDSKVKKGSKHKEPKVLEENLGAIKLVRDVPNRPGQKAYNPSYSTVPSAPTSAQSEPQAVASGTAVSTTPGLSREVPASAEPVGLSVEPSMSKEVVGKDKAKPMPGKQKAPKDDKKLPDTKELIPKSPMETARSDPATAKEPQKSKEKPQKIMNPVDELATPPQAKRKVVEKMKGPEKEKQEKPAARKVMSKEPKVVIKEPPKEEKKMRGGGALNIRITHVLLKESKTKVRTPPQKQTKKPESASFELAKEAPMKSVEQVTRRDATPNSVEWLRNARTVNEHRGTGLQSQQQAQAIKHFGVPGFDDLKVGFEQYRIRALTLLLPYWAILSLLCALQTDSTFAYVYSAGRDKRMFRTPTSDFSRSQLLFEEAVPVKRILLQDPDHPSAIWSATWNSAIKRWAMPSNSQLSIGNDCDTDMCMGYGSAVNRSPDLLIPGAPSIKQHVVLNDKRHVVTKDSDGCVSLYDVLRAKKVAEYGNRPIEDVVKDHFKKVFVPSCHSRAQSFPIDSCEFDGMAQLNQVKCYIKKKRYMETRFKKSCRRM